MTRNNRIYRISREILRLRLVLLFCLCVPFLPLAPCFGEVIMDAEDPAGDDYGPGDYRYPSDSLFERGSFDLVRFQLETKGKNLLINVTFNRPVRGPGEIMLNENLALKDLCTRAFILQNIDCYIDLDGIEGSGEEDALFGRRFAIDPRSAWEYALIITPQPNKARSLWELMERRRVRRELREEGVRGKSEIKRKTDERMEAKKSRVVFVDRIRVSGKTITGIVPLSRLGEIDPEKLDAVVAVTGATFESSFNLQAIASGKRNPFGTLFVRNVTVSGGPQEFSGGDPDGGHPFVIDMLDPVGGSDQREILGRYDAETQQLAVLPGMYAKSRRGGAARQIARRQRETDVGKIPSPISPVIAAPRWFPVIDRRENILTIKPAPQIEPRRGMFASLFLHEAGKRVKAADLVLSEITDSYWLFNIVRVIKPFGEGKLEVSIP